MVKTTTKYYCDCCNKEINSYEYEIATEIDITVKLPHPEGGSGELNGVNMKICNECSEKVGIVNSREYHSYIDSKERLGKAIDKNKNSILKLSIKNISKKFNKFRATKE